MLTLCLILSIVGAKAFASADGVRDDSTADFSAVRDAIIVGECRLRCINYFLPHVAVDLDGSCQIHPECNSCWDLCDRLQEDYPKWGQLCLPTHEEICFDGCLQACLFHLEQDASVRHASMPVLGGYSSLSKPRLAGSKLTWQPISDVKASRRKNGTASLDRKIYGVLVSPGGNLTRWMRPQHTFSSTLTLGDELMKHSGLVKVLIITIASEGVISVANAEFPLLVDAGLKPSFDQLDDDKTATPYQLGGAFWPRRARSGSNSTTTSDSSTELIAANGTTPLVSRDGVENDNSTQDVDRLSVRDLIESLSDALDSVFSTGLLSGQKRENHQGHQLNASSSSTNRQGVESSDSAAVEGRDAEDGDVLFQYVERSLDSGASRQRVQVESLDERVVLESSSGYLAPKIRSCSVPGRLGNRLLVCYSDRTFRLWRLTPSVADEKEMLATRIADERIVGKIATMSAFITWGEAGQLYQHFVVVTDHPPKRNLVTWHRFLVDQDLAEIDGVLEKKFWHKLSLKRIETVQSDDGREIYFFPAVNVTSHRRAPKHASFWVAKVDRYGMIAEFASRPLKTSSVDNYRILTAFETTGTWRNGVLLMVLSEQVENRRTQRLSNIITVWKYDQISGATTKIQTLLKVQRDQVKNIAFLQSPHELFLAILLEKGLLIYEWDAPAETLRLKQTIRTHGHRILPLDLLTLKDGAAVALLPSATAHQTSPSLFVYDSTKGIFDLQTQFACSGSVSSAEYGATEFGCLHYQGREVEGSIALDASVYLLGKSRKLAALAVMTEIRSKLVDARDPVLEKTALVDERLDQLEVLGRNVFRHLEEMWFAYGASAFPAFRVEHCEFVRPHVESLSNVDIVGEVYIGGNFSSDAPLPKEMRPLELSALHAVYYGIELSSLAKTMDFLDERLRVVERLVRSGKARVVQLGLDFLRAARGFRVMNLVANFKGTDSKIAKLDVADLLLESAEKDFEVQGLKVFMEPLQVEYAEGKQINGKAVDTFATRNAQKLVFKHDISLDSMKVSGHVLVGDGQAFGSIDLSENAVPLYKSILIDDLITGTWVIKNAEIKSLEGENQLVDGVNLDRFVKAVVQKDDPLHNHTNPQVIKRRISFRSKARMSIAPGGEFDFGPGATINRLNISRHCSSPFWLDGPNKWQMKRLVVNQNAEVPLMAFSTPTVNDRRYRNPVEQAATSGELTSVRGAVIAEYVTASSIQGKCPHIPDEAIPLSDGKRVRVPGNKIFEKGAFVKGKFKVKGEVNGHSLRSILQRLKRVSLNSADDLVVADVDVAVGANVSIVKSLRMDDLNGVSNEQLKRALILESTRRVKFNTPVTVKHLDAQSARITVGPFPRNIMTSSTTQIVSSRVQFSSSLALDDVKAVAISGFRMWDKRRLNPHSDYTFMRPVKLESLNVTVLKISGEETRRRMGIWESNGTTSFKGPVYLDHLSVVNGQLDTSRADDNILEFLEDLAARGVKLRGNEAQELAGTLKFSNVDAKLLTARKVNGHEIARAERFLDKVGKSRPNVKRFGHVFGRKVITSLGIDGLRLPDSESEAIDVQRKNSFPASVTFSEPIRVKQMEASKVSGIQLRQAVETLVLSSYAHGVHVFGRKKFVGNVDFNDVEGVGLRVGRSFNGRDPSSLLTTQTTEFRGPFTAPRNIIAHGNVRVTPKAFGMESWPVASFVEMQELDSLWCGSVEGRDLVAVLENVVQLNEPGRINATWLAASSGTEVRINSARGLEARFFAGIPIKPLVDGVEFFQNLLSARNGSILTVPQTVALANISVATMEVAGLLGILNTTSPAVHASEARATWREASFHGAVYTESLTVDYLHGPDGIEVTTAPICGNAFREAHTALKFDGAHVSQSLRILESVNGIEDAEILAASLVLRNTSQHQLVTGSKVVQHLVVDPDASVEGLLSLQDERCFRDADGSLSARPFRSFQKSAVSHCSQTIRRGTCGKGQLLPAVEIPLNNVVTVADLLQVGDTMTTVICQKSSDPPCFSMDIAGPALRGWLESPLIVDTDYFPRQYLPVEGIVRDVLVFSKDDSSGTLYCTTITASSRINSSDCSNGSCGLLELWTRVSRAGTWVRVLRITEPSAAAGVMKRVKIGWRHGFDFPHLFVETTSGEILVIQIERLSGKDLVHRVVNRISIGGDFDVLDGIMGTMVAFRDPAGAIHLEAAFEEAGSVVLSCRSSTDAKVKFLKRNDVEMLAVMESNEEEVADVDAAGKIKIFKLNGFNAPSPYQTLPSSDVIDSQAITIPSCSAACLATVEKYVGLRMLCLKGAGGFREDVVLRDPHLRRIIHKVNGKSPSCSSGELIMGVGAGGVKIFAVVLDE